MQPVERLCRRTAGTLLLALALAPAGHALDRAGEVLTARNDVRGTLPGAETAAPLAPGDELYVEHRVETGADSGARMRLGVDGSLALGSHTHILLDEMVLAQATGSRSRLSLLVGALRLQLGRLFRGTFELDTPTAVIGVKGTALRVFVYQSGITVVTVLEGTVTVRGKTEPAEEVEVRAGERTVVEPGRSPTPPRPATPAPAAGAPRLTGCTPRALAGQLACACGRFPDARAATGLRLDGAPVAAVAATDGAIYLRLPEGLAPGPHRLTGDPAAGFAGGECTVEAITVGIESERKVRPGQRTKVRLEVRGTRDKVALRLRNLTPSVARVQGGDDQVVLTSGGRRNTATRRVQVIGVGQGRYEAELAGQPCPCSADIGDPARDPELADGK